MMTQTEPSSESVSVAATPPMRLSTAMRILLGIVVVVVLALVTASLVTVPYYSQSPGAATPLESLIEIEGGDEFPSEGEVFFTTVRVTGELSALEWLGAQLDGSVVTRHRDEVLGNQSRDQQIQANLALMSESQELAKRVALEFLGYDVVVENGALITATDESFGSFGIVEPGDVVVEAAGAPVTTSQDLVDQIDGRSPGDVIEVTVLRLGTSGESEELDLEVILSENPIDGRTVMGVGVGTSFELSELPVDIDIDTARVGGPSAGLALTLSLLDILTEGELTGGIAVATTGTIDVLGNVGPIGGVEQKTHAVRRAGIDLFLVPPENFDAALGEAGDDLEVVAVATFEEAVQVLTDRGGNGAAIEGMFAAA